MNDYISVDKSILDKALRKRIVTPLVRHVPAYVTPDVISIASIVPLLVCGFGPGFIFFALALIIYLIGDCLDGEVARARKAASAHGHLLDHTVDCLSTVVVIHCLSKLFALNKEVGDLLAIAGCLTQASIFQLGGIKKIYEYPRWGALEYLAALIVLAGLCATFPEAARNLQTKRWANYSAAEIIATALSVGTLGQLVWLRARERGRGLATFVVYAALLVIMSRTLAADCLPRTLCLPLIASAFLQPRPGTLPLFFPTAVTAIVFVTRGNLGRPDLTAIALAAVIHYWFLFQGATIDGSPHSRRRARPPHSFRSSTT